MEFVWATALKDLRRRLRDPLALVLWLGIPVAILSLVTLAFGGGDVKPQARLLVVDADESLLSGFVAGGLGQGPVSEVIQVEQVTAEEGRRRIADGDGSALLEIPPGFGDDVLNARPTTLTLVTNPAQRILPGILEETLSLLVDAVFYLQRLAPDLLATIASGPPEGADVFDDVFIAAMSVDVNQLVGEVIEYAVPPRLTVTVEIDEPEGQKDLDLGTLFFQSMFFLAILFVAQGMSDDLWIEERAGTLRRALTTPHGAGAVVAGKLLAALVLLAAMALIGTAAGAAIYGFPLAVLVPAALWAAASGLALWLVFQLIQLFATSQKAGNLLTSLILFPLMMVGGSFFPFEAMPDWLAAIGRWTPNGWALERFKEILGGAATAGSHLPAALALVAFLAAAAWLAARRLDGGFLGR